MAQQDSKNPMSEQDSSRRDFIQKAAYVAPVILTLAVAPSYAKAGSTGGQNQQ
jgi:hypothetical protein